MSPRIWLPALWLMMTALTYPALNADVSAICGCSFSENMARRNLSMSILFAALPPAWVTAPFLTGFYEHGYQIGTHREGCP